MFWIHLPFKLYILMLQPNHLSPYKILFTKKSNHYDGYDNHASYLNPKMRHYLGICENGLQGNPSAYREVHLFLSLSLGPVLFHPYWPVLQALNDPSRACTGWVLIPTKSPVTHLSLFIFLLRRYLCITTLAKAKWLLLFWSFVAGGLVTSCRSCELLALQRPQRTRREVWIAVECIILGWLSLLCGYFFVFRWRQCTRSLSRRFYHAYLISNLCRCAVVSPFFVAIGERNVCTPTPGLGTFYFGANSVVNALC